MPFITYLLGALTILSACGVVFSHKSLNSALSLVATLFLVSIHFALLGAEFLAALQIMIYAGAIMVLVVFVIMLLGLDKDSEVKPSAAPRIFAAVLAALFACVVGFGVTHGNLAVSILSQLSPSEAPPVAGTPQEIGKLLYTQYIFAFEITGVLLLAAIIGAVTLAYDPRRPLAKGRGLRAMHSNT